MEPFLFCASIGFNSYLNILILKVIVRCRGNKVYVPAKARIPIYTNRIIIAIDCFAVLVLLMRQYYVLLAPANCMMSFAISNARQLHPQNRNREL